MKKINALELESKLAFAFENDKNVIVEGKHGVGKTSIIKKVAEKYKLVYGKDILFFSAATMDPWIDFLGVPKLSENDEGEPVVRLIKPEYVNPETLQVLFFDEFNRAPKRVRNAVMELIQFKSVNGVKFDNLKCVWAAINPEDEQGTYDVEKTDPAQFDRFHMQFLLEDNINLDYFSNKFGEERSLHIKEWYEGLEAKQKSSISPRRIEYALQLLDSGGDPSDALPEIIKVDDFISSINARNLKSLVIKAANENNEAEIKKLLNNFDKITEIINKTDNNIVIKSCVEMINQEQLAACLSQSKNLRSWCHSQVPSKEKLEEIPELTDMQKKIVSCLIDLSRVKNNKSLAGWAEAMVAISVPGYKFVMNKAMTSSEMGYQASERFAAVYKKDWAKLRPNVSKISHWGAVKDISFSEKESDIAYKEIHKILEVIDDGLKSKKCRNIISNEEEYAKINQVSAILMHSLIYAEERTPEVDSTEGSSPIKVRFSNEEFVNINYFVSTFYNIHKHILFNEKIIKDNLSCYRLSKAANLMKELCLP